MALRKLIPSAQALVNNSTRNAATLREKVVELIPQKQEEIKAFRSKHGETKIGEINVNMVYGGMRGMKAMVWETSVLDPVEGIRFQGYSIPELQGGVLPTAKEGGEPLPEGLFWLLVTGEIPSEAEVKQLPKPPPPNGAILCRHQRP